MPKKTARKAKRKVKTRKRSEIRFELKHVLFIVLSGFILTVIILKLGNNKQDVLFPKLDLTDKTKVYTGHPKYGLAGYTSGSVRNGESVVNLEIIPRNLSKVTDLDFPCEEGKKLNGYTAEFELRAKMGIGLEPQDIVNLGKNGILDATEQDGLFASINPISNYPLIEALVLSERISCNDSRVTVYGWDSANSKIVVYQFIGKDGNVKSFIYVPKGVKIPQRDTSGNIIEDRYDPATQRRIKVRYGFNVLNNNFEEIESWLQ